MLLTTGIAVPLLLAHTGIIATSAAGMSLAGGLLVYGTSKWHRRFMTVITYAAYFHTPDDEF